MALRSNISHFQEEKMRRSGTSVFSRALRTKRDWHVLAAWAPRLEQGSRYPLTPPVASLRLCPKRNRDILNSDYYHSTMVWMVSWRSLDPSFLSVWREIRSVQTMASPSGHLLPAVLRSTWAIWFARPWTYFASREVAGEHVFLLETLFRVRDGPYQGLPTTPAPAIVEALSNASAT